MSTDAVTEDISSDGFYCLTRQSFTLREMIHCELIVPARENGGERDVVLRYKAEVVRIVRRADGSGLGIGCRLIP